MKLHRKAADVLADRERLESLPQKSAELLVIIAEEFGDAPFSWADLVEALARRGLYVEEDRH